MYPDAKRQFQTFAEVPLEMLRADPTFQAQGKKTMSAVSRVVADLNHEAKLESFLREIGQMHKRRKVPTEDFKVYPIPPY